MPAISAEHLELIRSAAEANDLGAHAAQLQSLARPSVILATKRAKAASIPLGATKFGGLPDVPDSFEWPAWNREPHTFLAQVNLADIAARTLGLPAEGLLSFFFCLGGMETTRPQATDVGVIHYSRNEPLSRRQAPPRARELKSCSVRCIPYPSLPPAYNGEVARLWGLDFLEDQENGDELDAAYAEVIETIDQAIGINQLSSAEGFNYHQLLGYPEPVQFAPVEVDIERAFQREVQERPFRLLKSGWQMLKFLATGTISPDSPTSIPVDPVRCKDWQLLLMLQEDEHAGLRLVDSGRAYFMLPREELANANFERPWTMVEYH
jgi:uncharacterized protein YwqG